MASFVEPEKADEEPKPIEELKPEGPDDYYPPYSLNDLRPLYTELH